MIVKSLKKEIKEETSLGSLPDIDSDFGGQQRPRIKEYMEQEYSFEYSKKLLYDNPKRILEGEKVVQ